MKSKPSESIGWNSPSSDIIFFSSTMIFIGKFSVNDLDNRDLTLVDITQAEVQYTNIKLIHHSDPHCTCKERKKIHKSVMDEP